MASFQVQIICLFANSDIVVMKNTHKIMLISSNSLTNVIHFVFKEVSYDIILNQFPSKCAELSIHFRYEGNTSTTQSYRFATLQCSISLFLRVLCLTFLLPFKPFTLFKFLIIFSFKLNLSKKSCFKPWIRIYLSPEYITHQCDSWMFFYNIPLTAPLCCHWDLKFIEFASGE